MSTIVTRAGKGSPLTNTEVDANFTNLNTDKVQVTGTPTNGQAIIWNGTAWVPGASATYPSAGIANSTGSAWGTSYSTTGTGTVLALATSPSFTTPILGTPTSGNFSTGTFTWPTFNQNTTGNAATATSATTATNIAAGTNLQIPYNTGAGSTSFIVAPTVTSTYLQYNGTGFAWAAAGVGTVTSVAATVPSFLSISGSPITTAGTLAISYSGTALPVANGGTGLTSFTANQVHYGSFSQSANLTFDGTTLTAAGLSGPHNGTVGATTANTGSFTSLAYSTTLTGGTGIVNLGSGQFYKDASGNVGIGTSSPGYKLVTAQASGDLITSMQGAAKTWNIRNQADGTFGLFDNSVSAWRYMYDASNNHIWFNGSSTERMRIDSSGNVGIGTTSPVRQLTVSFAGSPEFVLQDTTQAANSRNWRMFTTSNTFVVGKLNDAGTSGNDYFQIGSAGQWGIGSNYGTSGQVLTSGGSGAAPSWTTVGGGGGGGGLSWQSVQTASFTAVSGNAYPINTTSGGITATLPASPTAGNFVCFTDYAGTFATNFLQINPNGSKIDGDTSSVSITQARESIHLVYIDTTQGWIPYSGFNTVTPVTGYPAEYLVIAGGGGGGANIGGGGGAGGYRTATGFSLNGGTAYTVTVGAGGSAGVTGGSAFQGGNGSNSVFSTITSTGGGGGGYATAAGAINGTAGGSGGGAGSLIDTGVNDATGGAGTSGQGFRGGNVTNSARGAAGGGGSSATGGDVTGDPAGAGGAGTTSTVSGSSLTYAGGGGGGGYPNAGGAGGSGGGGAGGTPTNGVGTAGTANTGGGGGGGAGGAAPGGNGANGGSGIVVIKYIGAQRGSGGTITSVGGYTIHTFTTSGTYTA